MQDQPRGRGFKRTRTRINIKKRAIFFIFNYYSKPIKKINLIPQVFNFALQDSNALVQVQSLNYIILIK
jgi:hypothetical protein